MTEHIMVDLETLGTGPDAVITSVGLVNFNPAKLKQNWTHYQRFDVQPQIDAGRALSADTLRWWSQQPSSRLSSELMGTLTDQTNAMAAIEIAELIGEGSCVWGNGATFDNVILRSFIRDCGVPDKDLWKYYNDRCFRTFVNLFDPKKTLRPRSNDHDALRDAENQVQWMFNIIEKHKLQRMF